jgi:hypothetical protein
MPRRFPPPWSIEERSVMQLDLWLGAVPADPGRGLLLLAFPISL